MKINSLNTNNMKINPEVLCYEGKQNLQLKLSFLQLYIIKSKGALWTVTHTQYTVNTGSESEHFTLNGSRG